jgi:hypothetical protein
MKKAHGTYSSTDPCDECGVPLKDCQCVCIKHSCCGGGLYYEGHLTDCIGSDVVMFQKLLQAIFGPEGR